MNNSAPDFSPFARLYAEARPRYPEGLFAYLASLVEPRELAWDCATGNGQAALSLVKHFKRVVATDTSAEQIRHAIPHPQVAYRVASAENSGLEAGSIDFIGVASAVHWFDLYKFYAEVKRVMRSGGVLAVWSYHAGRMEEPFGSLFWRLYREVLYSYFAEGVRLVDDGYAGLDLPGTSIKPAEFHMMASWNFDQLLAFIRSWSGTQRYMRERGRDPVEYIVDELKAIWGDGATVRTLRWPLHLRVSRL